MILKGFIAIDYWLDEKKLNHKSYKRHKRNSQNKFYGTAL